MSHVTFTFEQFEGPLDLLLALLEEEKLTIGEVSLSRVTEQYLHYLDQMEEKNPDELADFLVVATRLLLLKSKSLLPQFGMTDEEEGQSLEDQLRLYKRFVDVSKKFHKAWLGPDRAVFRIEPPRKKEGFVPPVNVTAEALRQSMVRLVYRLAPPKPLPETRIDATISMKEKIDRIRDLLRATRGKELSFHEVLEESRNKTEIIVSFLALLELMKQQQLALHQQDSFSDIVITPIVY